jgi:hypothetical protein
MFKATILEYLRLQAHNTTTLYGFGFPHQIPGPSLMGSLHFFLFYSLQIIYFTSHSLSTYHPQMNCRFLSNGTIHLPRFVIKLAATEFSVSTTQAKHCFVGIYGYTLQFSNLK